MKNPIRVRTNSIGEKFFDVYLYGDRRMFEMDEDEILRNEDVDVMYSGPSADLPAQIGKIEEGTRVTFVIEGDLGTTRFGKVKNIKTTPFYEIKEDETGSQYPVHRKYVKSTEPRFTELAEMYIQKLSPNNYRKYDLGAVKSRQATFVSATDSLADLASKGMFIIMTMVEV
jgi:hypothetical protein